MTLKQLEDACGQPVIIGTVISMVAMIPLHLIGMFVTFTKAENMFNPNRLMAEQRQRTFVSRIGANI
jgi:hypothetical protein